MKIYEQQTFLNGETKSKSYQEDSPVKMQVKPTKKRIGRKASEVNGQDLFGICSDQLNKSGQNFWLPKTWLIFLKLTGEKTLAQYSPNYPEWGIMQNGEFVMRAKKVPLTKGRGSLWLLTPSASDYKREKLSYPMFKKRLNRSPGSLSEHLFRLIGAVPGRLNPQFLAWMMGFPLGWLDTPSMPTETQSSQK